MRRRTDIKNIEERGLFVNDGVLMMIVIVVYGEVEICIYGREEREVCTSEEREQTTEEEEKRRRGSMRERDREKRED